MDVSLLRLSPSWVLDALQTVWLASLIMITLRFLTLIDNSYSDKFMLANPNLSAQPQLPEE